MNPYAKGDTVRTMCMGKEVEAEVVAVYKDEVQVKTPDGERRWRTVRTVQMALLTPPEPADAVEPPVVVPRKNRAAKKRRRG